MAINSNDNFWNLLEIVETENGITKLPSEYKVNGKYSFLDYKTVFNKETLTNFKYNNLPKINIFEKDKNKFYTSKQNSIAVTWSSETNKDVFQAMFIETNKPFIINGFSKLLYIKKEYDVLPKWLTWYLNYDFSIQKQRETMPYTTRCNMTKNEMKNMKIKKVPLNNQQEIINIIEPFEKIKSSLINKINLINDMFFIQSKTQNVCGKMIENNIIFERGKNVSSDLLSTNKSNVVFINVSAINNNQNKWIVDNVKFQNNVFYGDIILSLDGTVGLVNNFLEGYNGYGYKVFSKKIKNSQIFISLLSSTNKKIIKENSNGSVIKHASKSIDKLLLLNIENDFIFEMIYKLQIQYKKIVLKIDLIIKKLIEMYIV